MLARLLACLLACLLPCLRRSLGPQRQSTDGVEKGVTPGQTSPHREGSAWPADLPTAGTPEGAAASDATSLTNPQEETPEAAAASDANAADLLHHHLLCGAGCEVSQASCSGSGAAAAAAMEEEPDAMFWQSVEELEGEKRRRGAHAKHVARHQRKRLTKTRRRECARHAAWSDDMDGDLSSF